LPLAPVWLKCFKLNAPLSASGVRLHGLNSDDLRVTVTAIHDHIRSTSMLLPDVAHLRLSRAPCFESGCIPFAHRISHLSVQQPVVTDHDQRIQSLGTSRILAFLWVFPTSIPNAG